MAGRDPAVQFLDTEDGQIFIRCYGDCTRPALMLLHDAPGTGLRLEPLARALAQHSYVILPDLPGNGESDAPAQERPILEVSADALAAIADTLGLEAFALAAIGCGCAVAAVFGARRDPRLTALILQDIPEQDGHLGLALAPEIPLSPEGAHWLKAWLMLRDAEIYRPWFDGRVAAQRRDQGNFDADWLHDQTFALMKSRSSYQRLPRAAHGVEIDTLLALAIAPIQIVEEGGLPASAQKLAQDT
jgi:pimeloyl-ACP methyl ester carboxylesterase